MELGESVQCAALSSAALTWLGLGLGLALGLGSNPNPTPNPNPNPSPNQLAQQHFDKAKARDKAGGAVDRFAWADDTKTREARLKTLHPSLPRTLKPSPLKPNPLNPTL